ESQQLIQLAVETHGPDHSSCCQARSTNVIQASLPDQCDGGERFTHGLSDPPRLDLRSSRPLLLQLADEESRRRRDRPAPIDPSRTLSPRSLERSNGHELLPL